MLSKGNIDFDTITAVADCAVGADNDNVSTDILELPFVMKFLLTPAGALQTPKSALVWYVTNAWSKAGTIYCGTR